MGLHPRKEYGSVTQELLHKWFEYNKDTGDLIWKPGHGGVRSGRVAGCLQPSGYRSVSIGKKKVNYKAHRLVWMYHHGKWPDNFIDHINNNRADNRIENLRDVTHEENMANLAPGSGSSTGYRGVYLQPSKSRKKKKYFTTVWSQGEPVNLGRYENIEDAVAVYHTAREMLGLMPVPVLVS